MVLLVILLFGGFLCVSCGPLSETTTRETTTQDPATTAGIPTSGTPPAPLFVTLPSGETEFRLQGSSSPGQNIVYEFEATQDCILRMEDAPTPGMSFLLIGKDNPVVLHIDSPDRLGQIVPKGTYLLNFYPPEAEYAYDFTLRLIPLSDEGDSPVPYSSCQREGNVITYQFFLNFDYVGDFEFMEIDVEGPATIVVNFDPELIEHDYLSEGSSLLIGHDYGTVNYTDSVTVGSAGVVTCRFWLRNNWVSSGARPVEIIVTLEGE